MGFFADVGPMQIFVSIHLIPPDLKFVPDANPPNYSNEEQVIERGAMVRIKIMGLRMDVKDIVFPWRLPSFNYSLRSVRLKRITLGFFEPSFAQGWICLVACFFCCFGCRGYTLMYLHCERLVFLCYFWYCFKSMSSTYVDDWNGCQIALVKWK